MGTPGATDRIGRVVASLDALAARGVLAIIAAVAIPAIDGGELNELWWTVMAIALLGGIGMAITGVILAASDRAHRTAPRH